MKYLPRVVRRFLRRFSRVLAPTVEDEKYQKEIIRHVAEPAELSKFLTIQMSVGIRDHQPMTQNWWRNRRRHLKRLRAEADYSRFFGTFVEAYRSREAFLGEFLKYSNALMRPFFGISKDQVLAEFLRRPVSLGGVRWEWPVSIAVASERLSTETYSDSFSATSHGRTVFEQEIRNRRVLLIGPNFDTTSVSLSEFDVVAGAKIGLGDWGERLEESLVGRLTVSYLNGTSSSTILRGGLVFRGNSDFIRLKNIGHIGPLRRKLLDNSTPRLREISGMRVTRNALYNPYGLLTGPLMVQDLLLCEPKALVLSGFSLYIPSEKVHPEGYFSGVDQRGISASIRTHEPFSNFLFLKNLYTFGLISADSRTSKILSLDPEEYARELDAHFPLSIQDST